MSGDRKEIKLHDPAAEGGGEEEDLVNFPLVGQSLSVLRRVRALKKLQLAQIDLEVKFHDRITQLEKEFQPLFAEINQKRKAIITGEYEPKDEECNAPLIHGLSDKDKETIEARAPKGEVKGIPDFWHDVLLNCIEFEDMIGPHDLPILKYLIDVTSQVDQNGFTLAFHFKENPYFTDRVLKKTYVMKNTPDAEKPLEYDGPTLHSFKGQTINWIPPHTLPEGALGGEDGPPSFFRFFDPKLSVYTDDVGEEEEDIMQRDYDIATHLRDSLIPKAVLYLTDEIMQDGESYTGDDENFSDSGSSSSSSNESDHDDDMAGGEKKRKQSGVSKAQGADLDDSMTGGGSNE